MIYIEQNANNQIFVNVSEYKTLSSPTYLWRIQNSQSLIYTSFIPFNITDTYPSKYANKYDVFEFNTNKNQPVNYIASGASACNLHLEDNNQYWVGIYEQSSPTNLNVDYTTAKLLTSLAFIFVSSNSIFYSGNPALTADNVIYYRT
jgi:hypothetical protein